MADTSKFTIICPCCDATLTIDVSTGALLSHEEKAKPIASFDEMVKGLDKQKQMREQIFAQELSSHKDRDRILEEKFQEAMKRADKDKDKPYRTQPRMLRRSHDDSMKVRTTTIMCASREDDMWCFTVSSHDSFGGSCGRRVRSADSTSLQLLRPFAHVHDSSSSYCSTF